MSKKFYLIIIFVFALSALLLGMSYSKDSGNDLEFKLREKYDNNFRVVYSNDQVLTNSNNKIDFGITNITDTKQDYVIKLINNGKKKVYYVLDGDDERVLNDEIIFGSSLAKKGEDGDYVLHTLSVSGDEGFRVKVEVHLFDNSIEAYIKNSQEVYMDSKDNYRYYGERAFNYVLVDDVEYQIVGLINDKVRLVSNISSYPSSYNLDDEYLSLEDYLLSFNKEDLKEEDASKYKTWLDANKGYWLESDNENMKKYVGANVGVREDFATRAYYKRVIKEIPADALIVGGEGSVSSPYEVSYGS